MTKKILACILISTLCIVVALFNFGVLETSPAFGWLWLLSAFVNLLLAAVEQKFNL